MAYVPANLSCIVPSMGNHPALWTYFGTDIHTDVDAAGFFSDGITRGMKVDDIVLVIKTDATKGVTIHTAVAGTSPAISINPAILA